MAKEQQLIQYLWADFQRAYSEYLVLRKQREGLLAELAMLKRQVNLLNKLLVLNKNQVEHASGATQN